MTPSVVRSAVLSVAMPLALLGAPLGALLAEAATPAYAQAAAGMDSARCDSIIAASVRDSVPVGLFILVARTDGELDPARIAMIATEIASSFVPPSPFRLSVFSGPGRMRSFRPLATDTVPSLREPTLTGTYRVTADADGTVRALARLRASLMIGFDSAAAAAIRETDATGLLRPPAGDDSMRIVVRLSTDSVIGSQRMISARFPRMPVIDAVPLAGNPGGEFPEEALRDSIVSGDVVMRFVVDRGGEPVLATVEIVRTTTMAFARAALVALPRQRFTPATIAGCAVAQTIDYAFNFTAPERVSVIDVPRVPPVPPVPRRH